MATPVEPPQLGSSCCATPSIANLRSGCAGVRPLAPVSQCLDRTLLLLDRLVVTLRNRADSWQAERSADAPVRRR
jgi:hypothetical protein